MCENSDLMGKLLLNGLRNLPKTVVKDVRGKGLFCAIVVNKSIFINQLLKAYFMKQVIGHN